MADESEVDMVLDSIDTTNSASNESLAVAIRRLLDEDAEHDDVAQKPYFSNNELQAIFRFIYTVKNRSDMDEEEMVGLFESVEGLMEEERE